MATIDFLSTRENSPSFTTEVTAAFKVWYKDGAPADLTMKEHPGYGMLPKSLWTGGKPFTYAVKTTKMAGRSKTFADAKTNDSPIELEKFSITTARDYARTTFDGETLLRTRNDAQAFFQYLRDQTDAAFEQMGDVLAHEFYRKGTGEVASVASAVYSTNSVFTLTNKSEIKAFGLNDVVEFWDVSATKVQQAATVDNARIIAVDHANGTFTLTGDYGANFSNDGAGIQTYTADGGLAAGDTVAFGGDLSESGGSLSVTRALAGLEGWNPLTPSSSWYGVDQTTIPAYLAGGREDFTSSGYGMRETLMQWCAKSLRYGGRFDIIIMNPENFVELEKELTSISYVEVRVTDASAPVQIGYRAIELACPWGTVMVMADADCPQNLARGVTFGELDFKTVDRVGPWILDLDGNRMLRETSEDSYELRVGYYGQMMCYNPKRLSRCVLPSIS